MSEYNIQINKYDALNAGYDQLYPQPMKHANTHAKDGDDPITPSSIGAAELGADGKVPTSQIPSIEVDAYTKVQTLSDTTKTLFGLSSDAVPDDALAIIKTMIDAANNNANTKAKFATGSYTGTGKAGSGNKNTLTFSFAPKVVFVGTPDYRSRGIFISASQYGDVKSTTNISNTAVGSFGVALTWSGNSVSWYNESLDEYQLNMSGKTYNYIAIG